MSMTKQEQWRFGAIVIGLMEKKRDQRSEAAFRLDAARALRLMFNEVPWEYNWGDVVDSLRDRSQKRFTDARKSA